MASDRQKVSRPWVKSWRPRMGSAFEQRVTGPAKCVFYRLIALVDDDGHAALADGDPVDGVARLLDWPAGPPRRALRRMLDELLEHRCLVLEPGLATVTKFDAWQHRSKVDQSSAKGPQKVRQRSDKGPTKHEGNLAESRDRPAQEGEGDQDKEGEGDRSLRTTEDYIAGRDPFSVVRDAFTAFRREHGQPWLMGPRDYQRLTTAAETFDEAARLEGRTVAELVEESLAGFAVAKRARESGWGFGFWAHDPLSWRAQAQRGQARPTPHTEFVGDDPDTYWDADNPRWREANG